MAKDDNTKVKPADSKKESKNNKPKEIYYFYSLGCAWCKKLDPIVDELVKDGYNIIKLDTGDKDNREAKVELETKYKFRCGTPSLVVPDTGEYICGYKEKEMVEKLCRGEKIPQPPKPKSPPPKPPKMDDTKDVKRWEEEYSKWRLDNKHIPNIPEPKVMLNNLKRQFDNAQRQGREAQNPELMSSRLTVLEQKLDKLMNHLGVK